MKKYLLSMLLVGLLVGTASPGFSQTGEIANNYDFETALELSRILDRQFIFSFVSAECPHCQEYKDNILSDPAVREILNKHFILSFISVDETFDINMPEEGTVTNMQLASALDISGTPTTYIFYPPNPGLFQEGRGLTQFPGSPPNPEPMVTFLEKVVTESFKEDEDSEDDSGPAYYNYKPPLKTISQEDLEVLREASVEIPILEEEVELSSLPDSEEIVLDITGDSAKNFAERVLAETKVKKVFLVS